MRPDNPQLLSDQLLMQKIKNDDQYAFEEIYCRFWEGLYNSAYKVLKDDELARDVVQDVFIDLWSNRAKKSIDNPSSYFYQAVRFKVLMHLRKLRLSQQYLKTLDNVIAENQTENLIHFNELRDSLEESISVLPEKCREVFKLSRFDNLSHGEIAQKLNLSVRTVETHIHHALKHLRVSVNGVSNFYILFLLMIRLFK